LLLILPFSSLLLLHHALNCRLGYAFSGHCCREFLQDEVHSSLHSFEASDSW
jgi:hypothetical protein